MSRRGLFTRFVSDKAPDKATPQPHAASPGVERFTNALLRTHEGKQVRFYDDLIRGRQVMINLMYASCEGFCPTVTAKLIKVYEAMKDRMGKDLFLYSMTIKPEDDDPEALMHFAEMHNALLPGWTFLTGDPYDMETIRFRLFRMDHIAIDLDPNSHTTSLRIINDATNRWVEVNPMVSMHTILKVISFADPPKSFKEIVEANKALQEKIDKERKVHGYRKTV